MVNKTILAFLIILMTAVAANAQSYIIRPADSLSANALREDLTTLTIHQNNNTPDTLKLKWRKVSASFPANWDLTVCDNRICYGSLIDSGTMIPVAAGDSGLLLIHCTGHVNYGTAVVRYAVWDVNFPMQKDTLTYIFNVIPTGIETAVSEKSMLWYTQNKIHLSGDAQNSDALSVMDPNGREVYRTSVDHRAEFDISALPTSIYIVQLRSNEHYYYSKFIKY